MMRMNISLSILLLVFLAGPLTAHASVSRNLPSVGSIVSVKGDEQIRLVNTLDWLIAEIRQDLLTGDYLRTGPYGALAILFRDQTQIRLHNNSLLLVKNIDASNGDTRLRLNKGAVWSRGQPRPKGLIFETPSAAAAIRGTDWVLAVDTQGSSTVIVLSGEVELFNDLGSVRVTRGEIGRVERSKAPTKTFLISPKDRPQWQLEIGVGWMDLLPVTKMNVSALRQRMEQLQTEGGQLNAEASLELAEASFDLQEYDSAQRYLTQALLDKRSALTARAQLLQAMLQLRNGEFEAADRGLFQVASALEDRHRLLAELGRVGVAIEQGLYQQAEIFLNQLEADYNSYPEIHIAAIWLKSFRYQQTEAIEAALAAQRRFPQDARFPTLLGYLYLLTDQRPELKTAINQALALDPTQIHAWTLKGIFHDMIEAQPREALLAYRRPLALVPNFAASWGNIANVYFSLGEYLEAETAYQKAIQLDPRFAGFKANHAIMLLFLDRPDEAEGLLKEALESDPAHPAALQGMGLLAIVRDQTEQGIEWLLKATTTHPGLANANTQLGLAQYQAGNKSLAEHALENAGRLDPQDPIPDLIGSVVAQDHAEAGNAIRHARKALGKYLAWKNYSVETLASDRTGIINLGSAYANLGLSEWGNFYTQLSFDPYWANSHFGAGVLYESEVARRGSDVQGLLLDPLAYAGRSRYTDFVRRPFQDPRFGLLVGSRDGAFTNAEFGVIQGFERTPKPLSYAVTLRREEDDGFRDNADSIREVAEISLGMKLDESNSLSIGLSGGRERSGLLGPVDQQTINNDRRRLETIGLAIGYQHRIGPRNRFLTRANTMRGKTKVKNQDPFGTSLSDRDFSLISAFGRQPDQRIDLNDGLNNSRTAYEFGLYDATAITPGANPNNPTFIIGPLGDFLGLPALESSIADPLDLNPTKENTVTRSIFQLQFRHLFDLGLLEATYGAELIKSDNQFDFLDASSQELGTGRWTSDGFSFIEFSFRTPSFTSRSLELDEEKWQAYTGARWKVTPDWWFDGTLFVRYFDNDFNYNDSQIDPRLGVAWRITPEHWLRVAFQRELFFLTEGTLAPVSHLGLVVPSATLVEGDSSKDFQIRWDAEWSPHLFTYVHLGQQRIKSSPLSASENGDKRLIRQATLGANLWFLDRFGLSTRYRRYWTEDRSSDANRGNDLPGFADDVLSLGLTWIHPHQIRVSINHNYVSERSTDRANTQTLSSYSTTNMEVAWQPVQRHWNLRLVMENLFDEDYELKEGFPAPGFTISAAAEYRF